MEQNDDTAADDDYEARGSGLEDEEEEERLGDFGRSKEDYYNADTIETEQDALEEEKEARRIQQKQLEGMTEADFGFDEGQWLERDDEESKNQRTVTEKLPEPEISDEMSAEDRLKILKTRYPEFEHLAKDFVDLQSIYDDLKLAAEAADAVVKHASNPPSKKRKLDTQDPSPKNIPIAITKYRAVSAYLGVISIYFALLTSTSTSSNLPMPPSELREHTVIKSLVQCRQLWNAVKDIPTPAIEDMVAVEAPGQPASDEPIPLGTVTTQSQPQKRQKKRKGEHAANAAEKAAAEDRATRLAATEASLADLDQLLVPSRSKSSKATAPAPVAREDASDYGDEVPLTAEEAAAKLQLRKSLRFYTSQIAQKANKRGAASRDAGGDTDLPYKERLKDRQARLMREAERRGNTGADLDGMSDDEEGPTNLEREEAGQGDDDDEYYQTIPSRTTAKKDAKRALSAAHAEARAQNSRVVNVNESVGPDGKRGITYEIAKNKGLTPHRKKDVRNPRVKKRKKYDEKMKKLGSSGQRQIWKGGEGRGGYGGEATGIKKGLVRSVKL